MCVCVCACVRACAVVKISLLFCLVQINIPLDVFSCHEKLSVFSEVYKWLFCNLFLCVCVSVVVTNSILFCLVQIDIPLSVVFYKWLLCQEHSLNSADLHHIDPVMARSFQQLETILHQKKLIYADQSHVSGWHRAGETGHKNLKKSL